MVQARPCLARVALLFWSTSALTSLPRGIAPFERGQTSGADVAKQIRARAEAAVTRAVRGGVRLCELEFPPLLGDKTQFDDFDNVQVLNANQDWTIEFALPWSERLGKRCWVILPDRKEVEVARQAWPGKVYQRATLASLAAAIAHAAPAGGAGGAETPLTLGFVGALTGLLGSAADKAVFGDKEAEEAWAPACDPAQLVFVVQPGEGGPIEDWLNVEKLYEATVGSAPASPPARAAGADDAEEDGADEEGEGPPALVIVNGAIDKLRNGFYPPIFFRELGDCVQRFYSRVEPVYYLKPVIGGGVGGWLHRVYPEPWQIILQTPDDGDVLVAALDDRPTYLDALAMIQSAARDLKAKAK